MSIPDLTPTQHDELRNAYDAIRLEFAPLHRAAREALLCEAPAHVLAPLSAWLDRFFELADEVSAWSLASQQTDVPELDSPVLLARFQALSSVPLEALARRTLTLSSERLGERRLLALAVLLAQQQREGLGSAPELEAEVARSVDDESTWVLLDWFAVDTYTAALQTLAVRRAAVRQARAEEPRTRQDDATSWLKARGVIVDEPFSLSIRMEDLPEKHPKRRHLRAQVSMLDLRITNVRVRGPELDESWSLILSGAGGPPKHDFTPSSWRGDLRQLASKCGEVRGVFTEASPNQIRQGRTHEISATLESISKAIDAIEAVTGHSFHRQSASVTAFSGSARLAKLEEAARAWLAKA